MNTGKSIFLKNSIKILFLLFFMTLSILNVFAEGRMEQNYFSNIIESDVIKRAEAYMQEEKYIEAYGVLEAGPISLNMRDYGNWLKALSLSNTPDIDGALNICLSEIQRGGENIWLPKIKFLAADIYLEKKDFESAERIYEEEAARLLSSVRKENIAYVYIDFAQKLSYEPEPEELELPKPDYLQAYNFYAKAYQMEISSELKEQIRFNMARMQEKAGRYYDVVNEYKLYLSEYDPFYNTSVTSVRQIEYAGYHIAEARYRLAESYIKTYNFKEARKEQENLIVLLENIQSNNQVIISINQADMLKGDLYESIEIEKWMQLTKRRIPYSYTFPYPGSADELEAGLKATDEFLSVYPDDPISVTLAWNAIQALKLYNRTDETIEAARSFIIKNNFDVLINETEVDIVFRNEIGITKTPAEQYNELEKKALYLIGELYYLQDEYEQAIEEFSEYTIKFPDGPDWTNAQHGIVNSEFQIGIEYLEAQEYNNVRTVWNDFLDKHPLDERSRQILFTFAQIDYQTALEEKEAGNISDSKTYFQRAIAGFKRLISKYPNTEESSLAQYRIGEIYENELMDLNSALEAYNKVTWGSYYYTAIEKVNQMTGKEMLVRTERIYRTNENAVVTLQLRNVSSVILSAYKLNMEDYFHKFHTIRGVEDLDLALIAPDIMWEVEINGYMDYLPIEQQIEIPFNGPGVYAVNIQEEQLEATTLIICSDIDMVFKSSREEILVFVQNMLNNQPVPNADIIITDGNRILIEGRTGSDGVMLEDFEDIQNMNNICVFVKNDQNIASNVLDVYGLGYSQGLAPKGYIYTDRPVYRPGHTVNFRGIIRDVVDGSYAVAEGKTMDCTVSDVNGRIIFKEEIFFSNFGTFENSITLGENAQEGYYNILLTNDDAGEVFTGKFLVEQYKLEKIKLELEFDRTVYFRGEVLEGLFKAEYYFGEPVINTEISYTLPDGRELKGETDENGEFSFQFDTIQFSPGISLEFFGIILGENVSVRRDAYLANFGFHVNITALRPVVLTGESVELVVSAKNASGEPVSKELELTILRREVSSLDPIIDNVPWITSETNTWAEKYVESVLIQTDENGVARFTFVPEEGGQYVYRIKGIDRFGNIVTAESFSEVSGDDDSIRLRIFADNSHYKVGENGLVEIHSRLGEKRTALITYEGEGVIHYEIREIFKGLNPVDFTVEHEHFPNFTFNVAIMDGNKLRTGTIPITVERELFIKILTDKEVYEPGETAVVNIEVKDHLGNPVETELSVALVNEAVFANYTDPAGNIVKFFTKGDLRQTEMRMETSCTFSYSPVTKLLDLALIAENERLTDYERDRMEQPDMSMYADEDLYGYLESVEEESYFKEEAPPPQMEPAETTTGAGDMPDDMPSVVERESRREDTDEKGYWGILTVTDVTGQGSLGIELPETTTEYRIIVKGCTAETLVGEEFSKIIIRKDFFVNIKTPEVLQEGDQVRFQGEIHNITEYSGPVSAFLTISQNGVSIEFTEEININSSSAYTVVFPPYNVTEGTNIEVTLDIKALDTAEINDIRALNSDIEFIDSLIVDIPVMPWGLVFSDLESGTSDADKTLFMELPEDKYYENIHLNINIGGSINQELIDIVFNNIEQNKYLSDNFFLYSPGEVPSELLAFASLITYLENADIQTAYLVKAGKNAQGLISQLSATQQYNGSWDFGSYANTTEITCLAYWSLAVSRDAGIFVDSTIMESAKTYLLNEYSVADQENYGLRAMILHALSKTGDADYTFINRLYRKRNEISETALAYTALCLFSLDRNEMGVELINILNTKAIVNSEGGVYWNGNENIIWERNSVETTAIVLLAYEALAPDSDFIPGAVNYLLGSKTSYGFNPAKAKGPVINALTNYYNTVIPQMNDYILDIYVNNKLIETIQAEGGLGRALIEVPDEFIIDSENKVEFKINGIGEYVYSAALTGFSRDFNIDDSLREPDIDNKQFIHQNIIYNGLEIGDSTMEIGELEYGQIAKVQLGVYDYTGDRYLILTDNIPAGATVINDSVEGIFKMFRITGNKIQFYFEPNQYIYSITYNIAGYLPGTYRTMPPVFRDMFNPGDMLVGEESSLVLLYKGEESSEDYIMNKEELYGLGKAYFDGSRKSEAMELLEELYEIDSEYNNQNVAEMLLWIRSEPEFYNAEKLVEYFEILKEKNPVLYIPFEKILVIGQAYHDIGEYERAYLVYRATVDASFIKDAPIGGTLEQYGEFIGSIDFMIKLWQEYPDNSRVIETYFSLAQEVYNKAPEASEINKSAEFDTLTDAELYNQAENMLWRFMAFYPSNPLSDDSAFSMVNINLDKEEYEESVSLCNQYAVRYPESEYYSSFQYMKALALFSMRRYGEASDTAKIVAEGMSEDRDLANYILGQIFHAEQNPEEAINYYSRVEDIFPDAKEAIEYFEAKNIQMDEVSNFKPGEEIEFILNYRNIRNAYFQVYKVDLMSLYLKEKNLSRITSINLSGISPLIEQEIVLGTGKDYTDMEKEISLQLEDEGAYLVICRGDELFTSGLILITPLEIEVQEDPESGRVRVNVLNTENGTYADNVHVKVIGSDNTSFVSGETDMRGIFIADNIQGTATVIVRGIENVYAFFRGEGWLQPQYYYYDELKTETQPDYRGNIMEQQRSNYELNRMNLDNLYIEMEEGVQIQDAY